MSKQKRRQPSFKEYAQHQLKLIPPSWDELIPEHHVVRVVNQVLDSVNLDPLLSKYRYQGASSFHPRMMLKILVYGYLSNIYSSRKLEAAVQQNIHFMWLSGGARPDHNTINRFRSDRLKGVLKQIFTEVVLLMTQQGYVSLEKVFLDGTKMEANANRYSFVWGKNTKRHKERTLKRLESLWAYTQELAKTELSDNEPTNFDAMDGARVAQTIQRIDEALKEKPVDEQIKKQLKTAKKEYPARIDKYAEQERLLGNRNSYSKTDPDATFMRMKDDHMMNGQLKAAYNWQMSTSQQYILNYTVHQNANDITTMPSHLDAYKQMYGKHPDVLCADAGYGSEFNYAYLEKAQIQAYVKYKHFHMEQKRKWKHNPYRIDNLHYNAKEDYYVCPMGQHMHRSGSKRKRNRTGQLQEHVFYKAKNCRTCPMRGACFKSKGNRRVEVNHRLTAYQANARQRLHSDMGIQYRKQRPADVEAVFGQIKHNKNFKRFMLRGKDKVLIELGLLSLAHNLAKMARN